MAFAVFINFFFAGVLGITFPYMIKCVLNVDCSTEFVLTPPGQ